ncbi:hypothetical protein TorRG33x02_066970, partial [Trema orientale]
RFDEGIDQGVVRDNIPAFRVLIEHPARIREAAAQRVDADEGISDERISGERELEGLSVKSLGGGNGVGGAQVGGGLEGEREGVEIRREGEAAHAGEEEESLERRGEERVGSNDVVEGKG